MASHNPLVGSIRRLVVVLFVLVICAGGCQPPGTTPRPTPLPTPPTGNVSMEYSMDIPLGAVRNKFRIHKTVYMGWDVTSFKLKFKFYPRPRLFGGVHIELWRGDTMLQDALKDTVYATDNTFYTNEVQGNWVDLHIYSDDFIDFDPQNPFQHLFIMGADISYDRTNLIEVPTEPINQIKLANTNTRSDPYVSARRLLEGIETISLSQGITPVQHFYFEGTGDNMYLVYISPIEQTMANDTAIQVGVGRTQFIPVPVDAKSGGSIRTPMEGDTGLLFYWGPYEGQNTLFLTIRQGYGASALISINKIDKEYSFNIEMENGLSESASPEIDEDQITTHYYGDPIKAERYTIWPYGFNEAGFVGGTDNLYNARRVDELIVFFAADLLNASEGQLFIDKVTVYRSTHWYVNSDVVIYNNYDRANAGYFKIKLYKDALDNPIKGGKTLNHEWAHFKLDLPDEYPADYQFYTDCMDPNTLMCDPRDYFGDAMREFCSIMNHPSSAGEKSNWQIIWEKEKIFMPGYPDQSSSFHDVLNALLKMTELEWKD
jgi:hypothetical protein